MLSICNIEEFRFHCKYYIIEPCFGFKQTQHISQVLLNIDRWLIYWFDAFLSSIFDVNVLLTNCPANQRGNIMYKLPIHRTRFLIITIISPLPQKNISIPFPADQQELFLFYWLNTDPQHTTQQCNPENKSWKTWNCELFTFVRKITFPLLPLLPHENP